MAPGPHQRVLGRILREFGIAKGEASDRVQPIDGASRQDAEGLSVPASRPVDELRLHASLLPGATDLVAYTLRRSAAAAGSFLEEKEWPRGGRSRGHSGRYRALGGAESV
jgi:hypothetical protein